MFKILLSFLFALSLASADDIKKASGCDLSVVGDVMMYVNSDADVGKKATYTAVAPSGKNFYSILVGSTMSVDGVNLKILDVKSNKRVKREPRTGIVSVVVSKDGKSKNIDIPYSYDKGVFSAKSKHKDAHTVGFVLEIKALLCYV